MSDNARRPLAVVFGCAGPALTGTERSFFREADPLGFALFKRNCHDPAQLRHLCGELRDTVGRADAPILIDQEGGRVQRLKPPHWPKDPPPARFGALAERDPGRAEQAVRLMARAIAADLAAVGVSGNAFPVLDLAIAGASDVIGDRAFSGDPAVIARLGAAACLGTLDAGVFPIIKHLPGHGRALVDSHKALPVVDADLAVLEASDFVPFRALAEMPWAMTAHVVYPAIDPELPGTLSAVVIERIIRGRIGFDGVLITDDLCMGALSGPIGSRARLAIEAGCDIALHCNGVLEDMAAVAREVPRLGEVAADRLARTPVRIAAAGSFESRNLRAEVAALLAEA